MLHQSSAVTKMSTNIRQVSYGKLSCPFSTSKPGRHRALLRVGWWKCSHVIHCRSSMWRRLCTEQCPSRPPWQLGYSRWLGRSARLECGCVRTSPTQPTFHVECSHFDARATRLWHPRIINCAPQWQLYRRVLCWLFQSPSSFRFDNLSVYFCVFLILLFYI